MKLALHNVSHLGKLLLLAINQDRDGKISLSSCELTRAGDKITVSKKNSELKNITHFAKQHQSGTPVVLTLSGKVVLQKEAVGTTSSALEAFNLTLPNSKADDFYLQWLSGESQRITMVRKEAADSIMNELSDLGFVVVSLSLNLDEAELKKAGVNLLLELEVVAVGQPMLVHNLEQIRAKEKLKGIGLITACLVFVTLVVNILLNATFSEKAIQLRQQQDLSLDKVGKYQMIESDVVEKISLIKTTGWTGGYPLAFLTDRVMASKPVTIGMSQFVINPLMTKDSDERGVAYENLKILINGNSNDAAELNNWLHKIRSMTWVRDCELVSYSYNKESGRGEFMLALNIQDVNN
jgi:hypothetical protein